MFFVPPEVEIGVWMEHLNIPLVVPKALPARGCHRAAGVMNELVKVGLEDSAQGPDAYWPFGEQNEHDSCVQIHFERFLDTL